MIENIDLELLPEYVKYSRTQGLSENTITIYGKRLKAIKGTVQDHFSRDFGDKRNQIHAFRSFLRFLAARKLLSREDLADALEEFKPPVRRGYQAKRKYRIPREKWNDVIRKAPNRVGKMGIWIGFQFGLRLGEIIHLRIDDIDFTNKTLTIRKQPLKANSNQEAWNPKYCRERELPLVADQLKMFRRWIAERKKLKLDHPYLLWTPSRSRKGKIVFGDTFQWWCNKAGIYPHVLRYSFATHYYDVCKDVKLICELLGHSNVATTSRYLQLDINEVHDRARELFSRV